MPTARHDLVAMVGVPSVSSAEAHAADVERACEVAAALARDAGAADVRVVRPRAGSRR